MKRLALLALMTLSGTILSGTTLAAQTYTESEPNDTKATADAFSFGYPDPPFTPGDRIVGVSGTGDVDRFRISAPGGRSVFNRTNGGSTDGLHGLSLNASGTADLASDPLVQPAWGTSASATNQLYRFSSGADTGVDYRVARDGAAALYEIQSYHYYTDYIVPISALFQGPLTITAGSDTIDSDILVIGTPQGLGLNPPSIRKANNDASATTLGSRVSITIPTGGSVMLAISDVNLITSDLPDADEFARTPNDFRTNMFENPGYAAAASTATVAIPFTISDNYGHSYSSVYQKTGHGVGFFAFNTQMAPPVPEPATFAALGLGALALIKRRRKG